jgi:mannose-1-phosphate guanylyltransferase/mannose-6-phosphate isomerase
MEKAGNTVVMPLNVNWNDVGAWSALWDLAPKDGQGNVRIGQVFTDGVDNSYIRAESKIVAVVGLSDCVVVDTADAVLVAKKDQVQNVKAIVEQLKDANRPEVTVHRKVYRPWGAYEGVDGDKRFQVKRITVKPGASLSLQKHHHRAEHWIVVTGTARVTRGDESFVLSENESTFIPLGTVHRLQNPGKIPLQLIEVQSGSYLGEDDIVRIKDEYGRSGASR